jgi:hypothetical protein
MQYARIWTLAPLLALLPWAAARGDHWAPHEITEKFLEVDKKLEALDGLVGLARADRAAARRIGDLETEVRELRSQVDQLGASIKSLQQLVQDLRADLAKAAATRAIAQTPDRTRPDAVEPAPEPTATRITSKNTMRDGDFLIVTGTVENTSEAPLTFVVVKADFLDNQRNVVHSASAYTNPRVIPPGGKATFRINTRFRPGIHDQRLTVEHD